MKNRHLRHAFACLAFLLTCLVVQAQEKAPVITLETPHNTVYSHLYYLQPESFQPAEAAKTIPGLEGEAAENIALKIKQILDAKGLMVTISDLPQEADFRDSTKGEVYTLFPKEAPEIYLRRINGKWYYSPSTVEKAPQLHKQLYPLGSHVLLKMLPRFGTGRVLGLMVWQYIGIGFFLVAGFLLYFVFRKMVDLIIPFATRIRFGGWQADKKLIYRIARLSALLLVLVFIGWFLPVLQLPVKISANTQLVLDILRYAFITLLALRIFDFIVEYLEHYTSKTTAKMDGQLLVILRRFVQIGIAVFGIITILNRLDVNVAALVAGVSIGGLAIALAAQDSVKNLIGALMIFIDRPFEIGDYIIAGSVQGVVQEVGFRSTRLQASDTSMISVPNGKIADEIVNNLGRRVYRRYRTQLSLPYDTPPELVGIFVEGVRDILKHDPNSLDDKTQVFLNEFSPASLTVLMQTFFSVDGWDTELQTRQELMLNILQLARELGVEFAAAQTMRVEGFPEKGGVEKDRDMAALRRKKEDFMKKYCENLEKRAAEDSSNSKEE